MLLKGYTKEDMTIIKSRIPFSYRTGIVVGLVLVFVFYGILRAKNFLDGPSLVVTTPKNGEVTENQEIIVSGKTKNISSLNLNGRQIFTDKNGDFSEHLLLPRGYTIMEVKASDRFGRVVAARRGVILK